MGYWICSKVVFGYIPTGSGNDFTRALKIPTDPQKAWESIRRRAQERKMDLGVIECGEKQYRFAVSAGIGFDAAVCHQVNRSKLEKDIEQSRTGKTDLSGRCVESDDPGTNLYIGNPDRRKTEETV